MPSPRVHPVLLAVLLFGIAALAVQGLRLARDRQFEFVPERAPIATVGSPDALDLERGAQRDLAVDLGDTAPEVLGLLQIFPERQVLRWVEQPTRSETGLVIPLGGLPAGRYRLVGLPRGTEAGPREMDRPEELQIPLLEFELR